MRKRLIYIFIMVMVLLCTSVITVNAAGYTAKITSFKYQKMVIPSYDGDSYEVVRKNDPRFTKTEKTKGKNRFEKYASLDSKGRPGVAYASLTYKSMPTYKRGSISTVKPKGWVQVKYAHVSGGWLYNRCHLIGFQLTGVDGVHSKAKYLKRDLITGTRFLNVGSGSKGMVKFENQVAEYLREHKKNHVLYRVTPVYRYSSDVIPRGVLMEAESLEDKTIEFCVFCYNVQPGVAIDYSTGKSKSIKKATTTTGSSTKSCYKTKTGARYHYSKKCAGSNAVLTTVVNAKRLGLTPCGRCT